MLSAAPSGYSFPHVIGIAIDDLNHGVTRQKILLYAGLLVAIAVAKGIFLFYTRWILIGISRDIEFDLRNDLFRQLEKQPAEYYQQRRTGDIMARMTNDLNAVRMLLGPGIMYSANTMLFSVFALYFLLRISPMLTLAALVPLPLASILVQVMGRKIHERFERIQAMFSDISAQAQENFSAARLIRAFAQEEAQINAFEHVQSRIHPPRPAPRSAHGHALADARSSSSASPWSSCSRRRPPGAHPPHLRRQLHRLHDLPDDAHLAHHRRRLGGQSLRARNRLRHPHPGAPRRETLYRRP